MEKVAIVILNWNGSQMLSEYLPSVLENLPAYAALYVADNASTDDSLTLLHRDFPLVRLIVLEQNFGFAEGYNRALKQIDADYYILLNSDVKVTDNWLEPLLAFMDSHPDYAACQPKLLAMRQPEYFEYAGAAGGYVDRLGYPFCRGRIFDTVEKDLGQYDSIADIHWATGACLMVRSRLYHEVGGLDARFFAHCEEIDFCWRLRLAGYKLACVPSSHVYHVGGATLAKENPHKTYLNFRNNLTMLYKNLPRRELGRVMFLRWFLDYLAAFQTLLLNGNYGDFKAIYRARRAFCRWKHLFKADRERIQALRKIDGKSEKTAFSILWRYYVKGMKHFSQL